MSAEIKTMKKEPNRSCKIEKIQCKKQNKTKQTLNGLNSLMDMTEARVSEVKVRKR